MKFEFEQKMDVIENMLRFLTSEVKRYAAGFSLWVDGWTDGLK